VLTLDVAHSLGEIELISCFLCILYLCKTNMCFLDCAIKDL
jgi:hypothetical protein